MKGDHVCTIPHQIWEWAQQKSGKKNPASNIRELLWAAWVADIQGTPIVGTVVTAADLIEEDPWLRHGLQLDPIDPEFRSARNAFVVQCGNEDTALEWFDKASKRGIHNPRAFLMSWYYKQQESSPGSRA